MTITYVIGDVHGCFYTLQNLLKKIYDVDAEAQLVFVGDYVDRGLHSFEVVELMIELQKKGAICLRGNHDDVIDWMVNSHSKGDLREMVVGELSLRTVGSWWLWNGLGQTLSSYIDPEIIKIPSPEVGFTSFVHKIPEDHKKFFYTLPLYWENETHFACHAYFDPQEDLPREMRFLPDELATSVLWGRFPQREIYSLDKQMTGVNIEIPVWNKIGIFGHTPVVRYGCTGPIKFHKLRLIDTGAFQHGGLTAYCCEQDSWILQATDTKDASLCN